MRHLIITLMLITAFSTCRKPSENNINPKWIDNKSSNPILAQDLLDFLDQDFDATLSFQRHTPFNSMESSHEIISAGFAGYASPPVNVMINSNVLNAGNEYSIQNITSNFSTDIYGSNLNIAFDTEILHSSFYSANPLYVSYDDSLYSSNLTEGMTFTWNADPLSQGVVFIVEASSSLNPNLSSDIQKSVVLDDNGSFTIPYSWLSVFPSGVYVDVTIVRGNYAMLLTSTNKAVRLISASACNSLFFIPHTVSIE